MEEGEKEVRVSGGEKTKRKRGEGERKNKSAIQDERREERIDKKRGRGK